MVIAFVARIDVKKLTECLTRCSVFIVLSYIILNFVNFSHLGHSTQYMNNAYSALIPVALLYNKGISEKKVLNVLLSLLAGFFLLVSGSRGAAITFIAFIFLYHIIAGEFTSKKLMIIVFACALMIAFVYNLDSIFSWLAQFFKKFGISTRLIDLINGSESGIYRSDGRVLIYETALERIEIIGGGLFFDRCITSYAYAHNFILEVLLDFGLILGIPILLIIGYKIFRFAKKAHNIENDHGLGSDCACFIFGSLYVFSLVSHSARFLDNDWNHFLLWHLQNFWQWSQWNIKYDKQWRFLKNVEARLKKNLSYQTTYQLLTVATPLIVTPYVSRTLGSANIGIYSYTNSIAYYFVMFALLGVANYGSRKIASVSSSIEKRSRVFSEIYGSQFIMGLLMTLILYGLLVVFL